jgi:hypothetical protein
MGLAVFQLARSISMSFFRKWKQLVQRSGSAPALPVNLCIILQEVELF